MDFTHPRSQAWLITGLVFVTHLLIAPGVPLGVDEAHYALYALHPALSYFDHPPMVAWLQMLVAPLGYNEFTLRLVPAVLYALTSLLVWRLTDRLFPDGHRRQGLVAVALVNSAPILQLMGWGLVPDAPLLVLALLALERTLAIHQNGRLRDWLLLGVIYGLAGLSKYTAVFLPLGLIVFLCQQRGWRWLRQSAPWLAGLIALLLISPVLIWNSQNDWASFNYQLDHAAGSRWLLKNVLAMQAVQMLCYSILAYIVGLVATGFAIHRGRAADWLVIWSAWPFLLVTSWSAGNGAILPNWPALGWVLLAPLSAHWLCQFWHRRWVKVLTGVSSMLSLGLILFVFAFLAFQPLSLFPFMKPVVRDLVGWDQAASRGRTLMAEMASVEGEPPVLLLENWSRASRIAWYARPLPVQVLSARNSQFSYWFGDVNPRTRGILIRDNKAVPEGGLFRKQGVVCRYIERQSGQMDGVVVNQFDFYRCGPQQPDSFLAGSAKPGQQQEALEDNGIGDIQEEGAD